MEGTETIGGSQNKASKTRAMLTLCYRLTKRRCRTAVKAYQTLGIVFGSFGTSPLYTLSTINMKSANEDDYLGVLSIIFWSFTLIGVIKHALILLEADDEGEGGTFALYSLLSKHAKIGGQHSSRRYLPTNCNKSNSTSKSRSSTQFQIIHLLEENKTVRHILFLLTMLGSCMLIGDSILTPAISVLSAIGGLKVVVTSISQNIVVAVSAMLLILLFLLQRYGTESVSSFFSPVITVWLVTTPLIGAYNIAVHYPKIFKAVSPHYIATFFLRNGKEAWLALAGTLLSVSGAEAMYADLGQFDKKSIRLAFLFVVFPSNLITYAGQTAYLIKHPEEHNRSFYNFVPTIVFWPMFLISTMTAIVASEGLISACFSLIKQSVEMDHFPTVSLIHTSKTQEGHVYSPEINYFLMALCTIAVLGVRDEAALGNAFGVTVIIVMLITTLLFTLVMLVVWGSSLTLVLSFVGFFSVIEGAYLSSVVYNIPNGGWLPFVVTIFLVVIMFSWIYGRQKTHEYEIANRVSLDDFDYFLSTTNIKRVPGLCIFYSDLVDDVPPVIIHYLKNVRSLHENIVITNVQKARIPTIKEADRFVFWQAGHKGVFRCAAQVGYAEPMDTVDWNRLSEKLVKSFESYIHQTRVPQVEDDQAGCDAKEDGSKAKDVKAESPVFVVGRKRLVAKGGRNLWRGLLIDRIYRFLHTNCSCPTSHVLGIPASGLVEIGMLYEV